MINQKERLDSILKQLENRATMDRQEILLLTGEALMYARILSAQESVSEDIRKILEKEVDVPYEIEWGLNIR